jgi:hypothetical protein
VSSKQIVQWLEDLSATGWRDLKTSFEEFRISSLADAKNDAEEQILFPDWWCALEHWVPATIKSESFAKTRSEWQAERGWILGIMGRSLPLEPQDDSGKPLDGSNGDGWDRGDLWHVLRAAAVKNPDDKRKSLPLFRDRMIVILNTHVLRSHEGRISHRLSWERTALDCIDCVEQHPRFQPLLEFKHIVIRVGVSGAVYIHQRQDESSGKITFEKRLLFDAIAKDGYHRDPEQDGRVLGSNSTFAASIFRALLSSKKKPESQDDIARAIREGITNGIDGAQEMFFHGYGSRSQWSQQTPGDVELDYRAIEEVLFSQFARLP